ncbi:hypothetical protein OAQ98_02510 [Alphaproteobacteria bacterium]|nr:hypothetical protein [Alphaproteobacteria bacterium]
MSLGFTIDQGNKFNAIFAPLAKKIAVELQKHNVHIFFADQNISQNFPRLIFGAHASPDFWLENKKNDDIFINLEPIYLTDWQVNNFAYCKLLNSSKTLDYTNKTKKILNQSEFLPLPPLYQSIDKVTKDREILFVGSVNKRRKLILDKLINNDKIDISIKFEIFGQELFKEIEKSKILLDLNTHKDYMFNIYRFCLCADSNTLYIGEFGDTSDYPEIDELKGLTIAHDYNELLKIITNLQSDEDHLKDLILTQRKLAKRFEIKFQKFIGEFSKEYQ